MPSKANRRIRLMPSVLILSMLLTAAGGKTIYVDDDAAGANDGSSWEGAYTFLQEALADASLSEKPVEIRVAQGIYRPNGGLVATPEFDWRTTTFQLINSVALKGGYAGLSQPDPNARDVQLYKTILSGDLNGNDVDVADPSDLLNELTRADNSYHVVIGSGTDDSAVLDGFTVMNGNANVANRVRDGGGMYVHSGSPILRACIFIMNSAYDGGAIYNYEGRPALTDCVFSRNRAYYGGGGMMNFFNGSPVLIGCTFSGNSAEWGGGIHNSWDCNPSLTNCIFSSNSANDDGGGILNEENSNPHLTDCIFNQNVAYSNNGGGMCNLNLSSPTVLNCTFTKNAANLGGGMANTFKSNPTLTNCILSGNQANGGGGMGNLWESSPVLANCIFSGNIAIYEGGGMDNSWDSSPVLANCAFVGNSAVDVGGVYNSWDGGSTLTNCIVWSNALPQVTANTIVSYSDVQGGWEGDGNIDADPLFAEPGYWGDANDPNIIVEPNEPNAVWVDGDYHLKSQAGRWDPASESWVVDDATSPCIDAGDPNSPVGDEPQPNGGRINMGAYGGTAEASKSPVAETIVYIQWLGHSSVKLWAEDCIVYVDPQSLSISPHDATLVLVTHSHGDHYSPADIARIANAQTQFIAPPDVIQQYGKGQAIAPGQVIESYCARLTGVAAYNINKTNHPKSRNWVGYMIELGGKRVYVAGDTDLIDEMKSLGDIDVAILPAGGTYTMTASEAAQATQYIK
ncbi:MAG TPA: MBL fold metallo-hydrolase, partial [Sedimentisphaerales bacterium]|nr:MBL fold metallo-hydrolase [Sedimentisphaerales bacterium]